MLTLLWLSLTKAPAPITRTLVNDSSLEDPWKPL
jgi:hypothetical protein